MDARLRAVTSSVVLALAVLGMGTVAQAASYTVNLNVPLTISRLVAVDQDNNGVFHESWPYSLSGPGTFTLTNPNPSPNLTAYFLMGTYYSNVDSKDHIFLTMNPTGANAITGLLFSDAFNGIHEGPSVQAIKDITSGGTFGDPTVDGGLSFLNNFATVNHDLLFTGFGQPVVSMQLSFPTVVGTTAVPVPAAVGQGGLLLGLLGGAVLLKRQLRRPRQV